MKSKTNHICFVCSDKILWIDRQGKHYNMNGEVDRLSSLPDELIHKILSFIGLRQAIALSVLSSRWRRIWTSIPYISFEDIYTSPHFPKFVSNFLSRRDDQTQVYSLELELMPGSSRYCDNISAAERVVSYALSHNVKELRAYLDENSIMIRIPTWDLPALTTLHLYGVALLSDDDNDIFSNCPPNLKSLSLGGHFRTSFIATPTRDLPALMRLYLNGISLLCDDNTDDKCIGLFSKCPNLKDLSLRDFKLKGRNIFNICHPRLSNLSLMQIDSGVEVVAPQPKNLTIMDCYGEHLISAPGLTSLVFMGGRPFQLSTQGFPSLEKADICIFQPEYVEAHEVVCLLQQLHNVKSLILNFALLELLSSPMERISHQPSPFAKYKITSVSKPFPNVCLEVRAHEKEAMSTETDNYVLDTSRSSIFPMVSCEEIRVIREIRSSHRRMEHLQHIWGIERNIHEHGKSQVRKQWGLSMLELQSLFGEMMAQIRLRKIESPKLDKRLQELISLLQHIEGLVTELPASKRDVMQVTFSSTCEDAAILFNYILGLYEDPSDEGTRLINNVAARSFTYWVN